MRTMRTLTAALVLSATSGAAVRGDAPQPLRLFDYTHSSNYTSSLGRPAPSAGTQKSLRSVRTAHIRLRGNLDCLRLPADLREAFSAARADRAGAIVIELDGDSWRADVTLGLAQVIAEHRASSEGSANAESSSFAPREDGAADRNAARIIVLLDDRSDHTVGSGQAALALAADAAYVGQDVSIVGEADHELTLWYPVTLARTAVLADLRAVLAVSCTAPGRTAALADLLPRPSKPMWWIGNDPWTPGPASLSTVAPPTDPPFAAGTLAGPPDATPEQLRLAIDARAAVQIGLARAAVSGVPAALTVEQLRASSTKRIDISSDLMRTIERAERELADLDTDLRQVSSQVRDAARSRSVETLSKRRAIGETASDRLDKLERRLAEVEAIAAEYPELLTRIPPGQTPIGQTASRLPLLWRDLFQTHRDTLADLRARARSLADAEPP